MKRYQLLVALSGLVLFCLLSLGQVQYARDYPQGYYAKDYPQGYYPTYYPSSYWGYSPTYYSINYPYYYSYINPSFYPTYLPYRYYNYPYYYGYGSHFPSGVLGQELAWRTEAYRFLNSPQHLQKGEFFIIFKNVNAVDVLQELYFNQPFQQIRKREL